MFALNEECESEQDACPRSEVVIVGLEVQSRQIQDSIKCNAGYGRSWHLRAMKISSVKMVSLVRIKPSLTAWLQAHA
eukprot:4934115-Amphidinium_carterae.1